MTVSESLVGSQELRDHPLHPACLLLGFCGCFVCRYWRWVWPSAKWQHLGSSAALAHLGPGCQCSFWWLVAGSVLMLHQHLSISTDFSFTTTNFPCPLPQVCPSPRTAANFLTLCSHVYVMADLALKSPLSAVDSSVQWACQYYYRLPIGNLQNSYLNKAKT